MLSESLKTVHAQFPFYVLCPNDIAPEVTAQLKKKNISILMTDNLSPDISDRKNLVEYWKDTLFKLKIFCLDHFEKIVFLDADMIILENIDFLFERPHMTAVAAGNILHSDWVRLNSGLMVIIPDKNEYEKLLQCIDPVYEECTAAGCGFGDQDVINAFYRDWPEREELHLNERYNVMLGYAGYLKKAGMINNNNGIAVYHFTGKQKPWGDKLTDRISILFKILKRGHSVLDVKVFLLYRRMLRGIRIYF